MTSGPQRTTQRSSQETCCIEIADAMVWAAAASDATWRTILAPVVPSLRIARNSSTSKVLGELSFPLNYNKSFRMPWNTSPTFGATPSEMTQYVNLLLWSIVIQENVTNIV